MCMKIKRSSESQMSRMKMMTMTMMMTVLVASLAQVVIAEENIRPPGLLNRVTHSLYNGFVASSDNEKNQYLKENEKMPRRMLSPKDTEEKNDPEWNYIRKKDNRRGVNPGRQKMKIKKQNSPRKKIPAFIRRVMPLGARPGKHMEKNKDKNSKKTISTVCGKSYEVNFKEKYKISVSKSVTCKTIFRAAAKTAMSLSCSSLRVGNCSQGVLYFSDGGKLNTKYCGNLPDTKVNVKMLTELFVGYDPVTATTSQADSPSVSCRIRGKKGSGYKAKGLQICPLTCGKTWADAEANRPISTDVLTISTTTTTTSANTTTTPTLSTETSLTNGTETTVMSLTTPTQAVVDAYSTTTDSTNTTPASSPKLSTSTISKSTFSNWNTTLNNFYNLKLPWQFVGGAGDDGKVSQQSRVEGGKNASPGEWPFIVYIKMTIRGSLLTCGGSIVSSQHILTAAHCVFDVVLSLGDKVIIVANEYNLNNKTETITQKRAVSQIYLHPKYNSSTQSADIAVLKLKNPLKMSNGVTPICIAPDRDYVGTEVVILGWGSLTYSGGDPSILQEATQVVNDINECARNYSTLHPTHTHYPITKKHLCASSPGIDSCLGDSGGPVIVILGTTWYQVGIVSFGYRCAVQGFPGVNTFVPGYASWLYKTINKDTCD